MNSKISFQIVFFLFFAKSIIVSGQENEIPNNFDLMDLKEKDVEQSAGQFRAMDRDNLTPININNASRQELSSLNLLSPFQITNLINHVTKNGPIIHLAELQTISGFNATTIKALIPHVMIDQNELINVHNFKKQLLTSEHLIITRVDKILQEKKGFINNDFQGDRNRYYFKYKLILYFIYSIII